MELTYMNELYTCLLCLNIPNCSIHMKGKILTSTCLCPQLRQYQYYSTGLLSNYDKYPEHSKSIVGHKKKLAKEQKKAERKAKGL